MVIELVNKAVREMPTVAARVKEDFTAYREVQKAKKIAKSEAPRDLSAAAE